MTHGLSLLAALASAVLVACQRLASAGAAPSMAQARSQAWGLLLQRAMTSGRSAGARTLATAASAEARQQRLCGGRTFSARSLCPQPSSLMLAPRPQAAQAEPTACLHRREALPA